METTGSEYKERPREEDFLRIDRKYIKRCGEGCDIPLYQRIERGINVGFSKYGELAKNREALLQRAEENKLPRLYIHDSTKKQLYEMSAENCLRSLTEILKSPEVIDKSMLTDLVTDFADITVEKNGLQNNVEVKNNFKRTVNELLRKYLGGISIDLIEEINKLEVGLQQN